MSQKIPGDSGQKGFAVGRGLLAAAETLNFSMGDPGSGGMYGSASRPVGGMPRGGPGGGGLGAGGGGGIGQGPKDPQHDPQLSRRVGSHLGSTMKLFASLGLSPADLDELAQIPEDSISVETLPTLIMQLKNRKMDTGAGRRMSDPHRDMSSALSQETSYRPGRDNWADMQDSHHHHHHHHLESSPMGHGSGRGNVAQSDFGYGSMQDMPPPLGGVGGGGGGGYDSIDYGHGSGGGASIGGRERQYSELSHDSYRGLGMGTSMSMSTPDSMLMQRRMGSPSHGKVQDFMGAMPHMFPHVCSLCDFDVHSTMEWNQHTNGLRHSENCRLLLQMYPEWDPHMPSNRGAGLHSMDPSGRSDGLLGAAPQGGGMGSNWGSDTGGYGGYSNKQQALAPHGKVRRGRVIVVKYDRKPQPTNSLFALAKPFGTVRENLVLKKKAFLELATHEEAKAMADFYQRKPAMVNGKEVQLYLSREIAVIDKTLQSDPLEQKGDRRSQVVFFSNLRRDMNKSQLLSVCQQFGTVEKHLFLAGEAFVQMKTPNDAEMLVKYYTLNPLSIKGKNIRLNICTKYKTLTVHQGRAGQGKQDGKGNNSGSKASSTRGQRSSSSRAKDASSDKADTSQDKNKEMEEDEEEGAQGEEGSGDEVAGVMEGDEQEEEEGGDEEQGDDEEDMEQDGAEESAEQQEANKADPEENAEEGGDANTCSAEVQGDGDEKGQEQSQEEEKGDGEEDQKEKEAASSQDEAAMEETAGADLEASTEAAKDPEAEEGPQDDSLADDPSEDQCGEPDFPENMDDFVTLDELAEEEDGDRHDSKSRGRDSSGSSRKSGGLRVVNVVGFRRGINYLDEILSLAKPFGKVVRHLVLNVRPEAFLELSTEQEARSMVSFYNSNVTPSVCGKAVKIYHSQTYATIQSGKVIYVGQIPYFKTSDATLLKIAEPFGKIRRYYMNRSRNECFIEMENGEDAESMADAYKTNPPKFQGKRLTVYMSRKYKQLKHGHRPPSPEPEEKRAPKRERTTDEGKSSTSDSPSKPSSTTSSTTSSAAKKDEQQPPPAKKAKEDKKEVEQPQQQTPDETPTSETTQPPATGEAMTNGAELKKETTENDVTPPDSAADQKTKIEEDVKQEELEPPVKSASVDAPKPEEATPSEAAEKRPEVTQLPLDPHDPSTPIGVEFVKMGYYCRVCFLFYSNEETAKKVHCSSKGHYEKLKKHLEKEKAKSQSSNSKN